MIEALFLLLGLAVGAGAAWTLAGSRLRAVHGAEMARAEVRVEEMRRSLDEQRALLQHDEQRLTDQFKALSGDALKQSTEQFLKLAKATLDTTLKQADGDLGKRQEAITGLVKPLQDQLAKYEVQVQELEQKRAKAYGSLEENLRRLAEAQGLLQKETGTLANALRNPQVRGRWGELALQRVVELAGMTEHCDFAAQVTVHGDNGAQRPDMVVRLPGGGSVAVDAKAPLSAYLDALAATTEEARKKAMVQYVKQMRSHIRGLAAKAYWEQVQPAPEFAVMFIPGEAFLSAALEEEPHLLEEAAECGVIPATPTTLIVLLRTVALGWRHEAMGQNAEEVRRLGRELHERLVVLTEHLAGLGRSLGKSVDCYNKAVGSYESRVLTSARRFQELGAANGQELPEVEPITIAARPVQTALVSENGGG